MAARELRIFRARFSRFEMTSRALARDFARPGLPGVEALAELVTIGLLEVMDGHRPARQLEVLLHFELMEVLRPWFRPARRVAPRAVKVLRVIAQENLPGLADVAVVVEHGGLVRAVTWRFEAREGRWEAIEVGF